MSHGPEIYLYLYSWELFLYGARNLLLIDEPSCIIKASVVPAKCIGPESIVTKTFDLLTTCQDCDKLSLLVKSKPFWKFKPKTFFCIV